MNTFEALTTSETNEWYTPPWLVSLSKRAMGGTIDLDPASCTIAQRYVRATHYYSKKDEGFKQAWFGNVFLNPPYGKRTVINRGASDWIHRAISGYEAGEFDQAILIVRGDSSGLQRLQSKYLFAIPFERVNFFDCFGNTSSRGVPGTIVGYLGGDKERFVETFRHKFNVFTRVTR